MVLISRADLPAYLLAKAGITGIFCGGTEMTPEQLVQSFLASKPHLVRATQTGVGGGAQGGKSVATGTTGEVAEKVKKIIRDNEGKFGEIEKENLALFDFFKKEYFSIRRT